MCPSSRPSQQASGHLRGDSLPAGRRLIKLCQPHAPLGTVRCLNAAGRGKGGHLMRRKRCKKGRNCGRAPEGGKERRMRVARKDALPVCARDARSRRGRRRRVTNHWRKASSHPSICASGIPHASSTSRYCSYVDSSATSSSVWRICGHGPSPALGGHAEGNPTDDRA